jgi:hypothetical protein
MRNRWTAGVATLALVVLVGSGFAAVDAGAAKAEDGDPRYDARGFSNWQIVRLESDRVNNFVQRTVYCPDGKKVLGGGANASGVNPILLGSFPNSDGTGWSGVGRSSTASDVNIAVWAVCAKVS